jgi:hypothetical protein
MYCVFHRFSRLLWDNRHIFVPDVCWFHPRAGLTVNKPETSPHLI